MKKIQIFIDTLSATCRLPVYEITKTDCEPLVTCNQTRYNEEKRGIACCNALMVADTRKVSASTHPTILWE